MVAVSNSFLAFNF